MAKKSPPKEQSPEAQARRSEAARTARSPGPGGWARRWRPCCCWGWPGFSCWPWGAMLPPTPRGWWPCGRPRRSTTPRARPGPWRPLTSSGGWAWPPIWVPLMLLGLAWQSHHEGLEDLGWLQTVSGLGVLLASAGLLSLGWPAITWGGDLMYGGGGLGKLIAVGLCALPQSRRRGPGVGVGPARQCHGGHPLVLRGAHGPFGPGA